MDETSAATTLFVMVGLMTVLSLISGFVTYYSIRMKHTQHGHDDH